MLIFKNVACYSESTKGRLNIMNCIKRLVRNNRLPAFEEQKTKYTKNKHCSTHLIGNSELG
jgi:hypothetical protein